MSTFLMAIIVGIVWGAIKGYKENKSETKQDYKSKNQNAKQSSIDTQEQKGNGNKSGCALLSEENLEMKNYKCDNCSYCETTNNFFTRWCSYWNKMTFLTSGCSRETTVFDYDYDDDLDLFVADDDEF